MTTRTDLRNCRDSHDVLDAAGLNYKVSLEPIYAANLKGEMGRIETGHRAVVRNDTGETIAIVGSRYTPTQTSDFVGQLDALVREGALRYVSAMSVDHGRVVVLELQLPQPIVLKAPNGKDDVLLRRVLYRNSYDGTQPITLADYLLRQWCTNGATHILGMESHTLRHTASVEWRIPEIAGAVASSVNRFEEVAERAKLLTRVPFTVTDMEGVAERLFPAPEESEASVRKQNLRGELIKLFSAGQGNFGRSAWDAVNAITEWNTHHRNVRGSDNERAIARLRATFMGLDQSHNGYESIMASPAVKTHLPKLS